MMTKTVDAESYARSYIDAALESQMRVGRSQKITQEDYELAVQRASSAFGDLMEAVIARKGDE